MRNPESNPWFTRGATLVAIACILPTCKAKQMEELPASTTHLAAEQNSAAGPPASAPGAAGNTGLPPAAGAVGERPSLQQNMGRGFQGTLALRLSKSDGDQQALRFLSLGNTARLQVDALGESKPAAHPLHLDVLFWGEQLSLLDHEQRTARTLSLQQIRPSEEPAAHVELKRTGERSSIQGVFCEAVSLQDGPVHVDACAGGLPGEFDVDKLEAATGLDVPAWVETLVKQQLLPLRATARDEQGRELYRLELTEYSAGPVDRDLLSVPANYRQIAANGEAAPPAPSDPPRSTGGRVAGSRSAGGQP
jgi:hypothetical protein